MRFLLVEDEEKLAKAVQKALMAESYTVDVEMDGQEALDRALIEDYDLIILDLGLPSLDGTQVCKQLRLEGKKTPVLMLTARDTTQNKITGLDSGADDYLVKPFEFEELLARIRALLRRGEATPELIYKVSDLEFDPAAKTVKRGQKALVLSAKEYALLEFLLRHKGQIVSKSQIIDHVWDSELDPFSNVVDVYIGYLRQKLDKDFPQKSPLLQTIKGLGYRIDSHE